LEEKNNEKVIKLK